MTDKKERILEVALELFANEGYNAVSTNMIAKKAEVSEGLIFRHFGNKKGLLEAINKDAEKRLSEAFAHIIFEIKPAEAIRKMIALPFEIKETEHDYWRLQFILKWEAAYYRPEKMKPLIDKLTWAFQEMGYEKPDMEAKLLEQTMDSIAIGILRNGKESMLPYQVFLQEKYGL